MTATKQQEEVVMIDDPQTATLVTVTGWRSRDGRFYGDNEHSARWAGCTHVKCRACGEPTLKGYTACLPCRDKAAEAKYEARPTAEWDGVAMLYSDSRDEYFSSPEDAEDSLEEGQALADLKLRICEPEYARPIDCSNWHDQLPDDDGGDAPDWLEDAIEQFNAAISGHPPLSWSPGKVALRIEK